MPRLLRSDRFAGDEYFDAAVQLMIASPFLWLGDKLFRVRTRRHSLQILWLNQEAFLTGLGLLCVGKEGGGERPTSARHLTVHASREFGIWPCLT